MNSTQASPPKFLSTLRTLKTLKTLKTLFKIQNSKPTLLMTDLIPHRGNYKQLLSYQKANVIFQITCYFCNNYLDKKDRTVDQMIQAARSGKQNIIEGCAASSTSAKTEIKLINVAKASLRELIEDYEDYLAIHGHRKWAKESVEYAAMRNLGRLQNSPEFYMQLISTRPPETIANIAIILLNQADYLLFKQLQRLSDDFLKEGGFTERMYHLRKKQQGSKRE